MSVSAGNGGLSWMAGIDTSKLKTDADRMATIIENASKKSFQSQQKMARAASANSKSLITDALASLQLLEPEMQKQVRVLARYQAELASLNQLQATLDQNLKKGTISQRDYTQATSALSVRVAEVNEGIRKYSDEIKTSRGLMNAEDGSLNKKRIRLQQLTAEYNALSAEQRRSLTVGQQKAAQIRKLDAEISSLNRSLRGSSVSSRIFNQLMAATIGLMTIQQGGRLVLDIIRVRGEIEKLEVAFETILKSKAKAQVLMADIIQIATTTPYKLTEVADATKQLLAYGFAQEEITKQLLAVGNVASGVGSTFQEVAYAYGTLKTQGRAFARDIRQFTTRGIPIVAELAKQFGVSESKINDMVSAGKIGFPEVEKAFQNMTSEGGIFFNLMEEQSKTVTGEIAKLQDRIQLMFNDIGESNEGMIKDGIAGLASMVQNYESIVDTMKGLILVYGSYRAALIITATIEKLRAKGIMDMTFAQMLNKGATVIATRATTLWGAAMMALPVVAITAAISAMILAIYSLTQATDAEKDSQENLNKVMAEGEKALKKEESKINDLIGVLKSENATRDQKLAAYKNLIASTGDYLKGYTLEQIAAGKATEAIDAYTESIRRNVEMKEAYDKYLKLGDDILDLEVNGVDALSNSEWNGQNLKNLLTLNKEAWSSIFSQQKSNDVIVNQFIESLKKQREELRKTFDLNSLISGEDGNKGYQGYGDNNFDELINYVEDNFTRLMELASDKSQLEQIKKALEERMEALAPNDSQINEYKKKIQRVQDVLKAYSLETKEGKEEVNNREKILDEIKSLEDKAYKESFDKKEQEIQEAKRQFQELREAAIAAKLGPGVITRIDNLEEKTTGNLTYRSDTDHLKEELSKRKRLYQDYEDYIKNFGILNAEKRYGNELDLTKDFIDEVKALYAELDNISPEERTGPQNERMKFLEETLNEELRADQEKYQELLIQNQSYEEERDKITQAYILKRKRMQEEGDFGYLEQLKANYEEELYVLDSAAIKKLDIFERYFSGVENMSIKNTRELISNIRKELDAKLLAGKITQKLYDEMNAALLQTEMTLDRKITTALTTIAGDMREIASSIGDANSGFAQMVNLLSDALNRTAQIQANIKEFKKAKDSDDTLGAITAGFGIAGAAISGALMIGRTIKNITEQNRLAYQSALDFQAKMIEGELKINQLYRDRALAQAKLTKGTLESIGAQKEVILKSIEELEKEAEDLALKITGRSRYDVQVGFFENLDKDFEDAKAAQAELQRMFMETSYVKDTKVVRSGLFGMSKKEVKEYASLYKMSFAEVERLFEQGRLTDEAAKLFKQWQQNTEKLEEYQEIRRQLIEQEKDALIGGASISSIADTIVQGFRDGKRAVEEFGDDVEEILRNAIISGFKYRALEQPIAELLDQLYEDAKSDEKLSGEEIANFQKAFGQIVEEYGRVFEDLQNATGINLGNITGEASSLKNSIRRELTEQTASELAGIARSNYDLFRRHHATAIENLAVANKIEQNTFQTVVELRTAIVELKTIAKNTKPSQSARDNGLGF